MLETLLCDQRKRLGVQTLQHEPHLHAFKMSFLGHERCLSTLKYWCKDSWNAPPASFWCWSRMCHDHKMNANGITFWAPRWQRSPLDIYSLSVFNSREKKKRQDSAQQFQFTIASRFLLFLGPCETFAEAGDNRCEKKWNEYDVMSAMRGQSVLGVEAGYAWQHQALISVGGVVVRAILVQSQQSHFYSQCWKRKEPYYIFLLPGRTENSASLRPLRIGFGHPWSKSTGFSFIINLKTNAWQTAWNVEMVMLQTFMCALVNVCDKGWF